MDSYNSNHCDNNDDNNNNNNKKKNSSTNSNNNNDNNNNSNDNSINQQLLYVLFSLFLNLSKKVVFKQLVGCFKYLVLYMKVIFVRIFSRRLLWFENESSSVCIWKVSWFPKHLKVVVLCTLFEVVTDVKPVDFFYFI